MKKRLMSLLLTAAMIVSMVVVPAAAADPVTITVGSGSAQPGQEIVIPINISNLGDTTLTSLGYKVNFNSDYLTYVGISTANSAWNHPMFMANESKGVITIADVSFGGVFSGDDEMSTITLRVNEDVDTTDPIPVTVTLDQVMSNGSDIHTSITLVDGSITVIYPVTAITGTETVGTAPVQDTVTTGTVYGSYELAEGVSSDSVEAAGIQWGTSKDALTKVPCEGTEFSVSVSGNEGNTVYYQAYATIGGRDYVGEVGELELKPASVDTIEVSCDKDSIEVPDETTQFTAIVKDQFGGTMDVDVIWTEDGDEVSIDENGVLSTNTATLSQDVVTVTASYGGKSGSATIAIVRPTAVLKSMTIADGENTESATIAVPTLEEFTANGASYVDLSVSGIDQFDYSIEVKDAFWSVTKADGSEAKGVSIDAQGIVAVDNTAEAGELTVTAKSGDVSDTFQVVITKAASEAKTVTIVDPVTSGEIVADANVEFTYTVEVVDQFGAKVENPAITWNASSDKVDIASIADGKLTVKAGSPAGTVAITAACDDVISETVTLSLSRAGAYTVSVVATVNDDELILPAIGGEDVSAQFSATITDNWNDVFENASVTWALVDKATGVSIDENGKLTVTEEAEKGTVQVTATSKDGKSSEPVTVTITKAQSVATAISFPAASATHTIPTNDTPSTRPYTAVVTDQYGVEMDGEVKYALDGDDYVSVNETTGEVTVLKGAIPKTPYTLTATYKGLSAEMTITVVDIEVNFTVTAKDSAVYGTAWNKIVTKVSGTATLDGVTQKGTFSLLNGTDIPKVGENVEYTLQFVSTEKDETTGEPLYTVTETRTVAITPKALTLTWTAPKSITYTGEAPAITATLKGALTGDDISVNVLGLIANAGSHEATAELTGADKDNYTLSYTPKSYTINQAKATLELPAVEAFKAEQGEAADANLLALIGAEQTAQGIGTETIPGTLSLAESIVDVKAGTTKAVKVKFEHNNTNYVSPIETTVEVTFTDGDPQEITVAEPTVSVVYGQTAANTATLVKGEGALSASVNDIADYDPATGVITPKKVGTATITVTAAKVPGKWAQATTEFTVEVTPATLTISGITAADKVYDNTTDAVVDVTNAVIEGKIGEDDVTVASAKGTFAAATVGEQTVTITDIVLAGAAAKNYTLSDAVVSTTANITKADVTVTLDNLRQKPDSVVPVTVILTPASDDAVIKVEYQIPAVEGSPCKHASDSTNCTNPGACDHSDNCGYVAAADAYWTETVPQEKNTTGYPIRVTVSGSDNLNDAVIEDAGVLVVKKVSSSSSGSSIVTPPVVEPTPVKISFVDVDEDDWFYDYVIEAVEQGLFAGTDEDHFSPDMEMNRAMMVTVMAALEFGEDGAPKGKSDFTDLTADWYKNAVAWAAKENVTAGISDTEFGPDLALTREQVAVFLYAYAQLKDVDIFSGEDTNILSYNDAFDIAEWAIPAMQWACAEGLIEGTPEGDLLPKAVATRAQVAVILTNFDKLIND